MWLGAIGASERDWLEKVKISQRFFLFHNIFSSLLRLLPLFSFLSVVCKKMQTMTHI